MKTQLPTFVSMMEDALPRFNQNWIGVERIFDNMISRATNGGFGTVANYPPYNVLKTSDDSYEIQIAVAGFSKDELSVKVENGSLLITGEKSVSEEDNQYLYRGIAQRGFNLRFDLMDFIEVEGSKIDSGMLSVTLKREIPEAMKPRVIDIK